MDKFATEYIRLKPTEENTLNHSNDTTVRLSMPRHSFFLARLKSAGINFEENVPLNEFSYMRTGGVADIIVYPQDAHQLSMIMAEINNEKMSYKVIGNTSNLLFLDDANYSLLISTIRMNAITFDAKSREFCAQAGAMMPELSRRALYESITGFEGLEGIPGTVGGGLFMNAGAYGYELKDVLVRADIVHPDGRIESLQAADFKLSHRSSILRKESKGSIVCNLYFSGKHGDPNSIFSKMESFHAKRHKYQDFMYPNLGSIFSGSPYRALAKKDVVFRILSALYLLFRYEYKIFHRESPINRIWINNLAKKRFPLEYKVQPYSDKTLNCLVNRGQGTAAMVEYIRDLERLTEGRIPLENEIVEAF